MRGALPALVLLGPGLVVAGGCVDVCVLSGAPCDSAGDCEAGEVCRLRRGFEAPCLFAAGACEPGDCGSVDDCAADQCCHPDSSTCVDAEGYQGSCDERTCRDCPEQPWCPLSMPWDGPGGGAECKEDADCAADQRCEYDKCREICSDDSECPDAYCNVDTCTEPVGTPCTPGYEGYEDCGGASCMDVDASNTRVDGYCTRACYDWEPCPEGFVCFDYDCRRP